MTSHEESQRGARPPGTDDGGRNQSSQKDLSRTWLFAIIVYAPQSPRCEIYRGRYIGISVPHTGECEPETNKTKKILYYIQPNRSCIMMNRIICYCA